MSDIIFEAKGKIIVQIFEIISALKTDKNVFWNKKMNFKKLEGTCVLYGHYSAGISSNMNHYNNTELAEIPFM